MTEAAEAGKTARAAEAALEIESVSLRFGGLTAIDQVAFSVNPGEIYALIGPNGAGKTSLFNCITGLYRPSAGRVLIAGNEVTTPWRTRTLLVGLALSALCAGLAVLAINANSIWDATINDGMASTPFPWKQEAKTAAGLLAPSWWAVLPAITGGLLGGLGSYCIWQAGRRGAETVARAGVARTFQNIRLFRDMSVLENILVGSDSRLGSRMWHSCLRLPAQRREEAKARCTARELLALVGLEGMEDHSSASLPYGHQRRLEIARALASAPRLLLLDEPAAGMNPSESAELMTLIRRIQERGITILLIEHDMRVVMGISDRICVLHHGIKIAEGRPAQIRADPAVIAAYLGTCEA